MEFLSQALSGFTAMSYWEYIAVALGLAYLVFVMKESLWAWPCAFVSTFIYTLLFWNGALLMESLLNFYYLAMAVYGFYCWKNGKEKKELPISSWQFNTHFIIITVTSLIALALGYVMDNYTHADFAYLDSFTTCFAVMTTYLVAKKVLENWLYWLVIDAASIYLYLQKGYYPTVVLFAIYTGMVIWGYLQWRQHFQLQRDQAFA
ncbi:nicotinamide riboside transporter PnuC [Pseudoalteromonas spongiae]|uniref:nicotinamide riboside transporter PnuC n=1 Tax=Pseudoalteromonas spongiae TaxID=298657 RepID=UPI00026CCDEF|nr:nicotinamide riboside transporter PnuC [Pseudoalteromonas spongiae]ATC97671.1 nicotinamide mononucleotide transporter [Pseudoalteromonas spongiae UST010723-006]